MNTFIKTNQGISFQSEGTRTEKRIETIIQVWTNSILASISKFIKESESNRFGITPFLLLIIACVGGLAGASGIMDSWIKLAVVAFPATIALAMILAVAPMRIIFISTAIAVILDILVLIF